MSDIAVIDAPAKKKRINKTNLAYVSHHYDQALLSLDRAQNMMLELSSNGGGVGQLASDVFGLGVEANATLIEAREGINKINDELKAFFG